LQRFFQAAAIVGAFDLDRAQTGQMRGQELGVKQRKPPGAQAVHQIGQRQF
jgi:hypothetical protein